MYKEMKREALRKIFQNFCHLNPNIHANGQKALDVYRYKVSLYIEYFIICYLESNKINILEERNVL